MFNWSEKDLPQRNRTKHVHGFHPYVGKFVPQIADYFIRKYKPRLITDPFCGSGTTLVAANELGCRAFGIDNSSFAKLLSEVKLASYDLVHLKKEAYLLHSQFKKELKDFSYKADNQYLNKWFCGETISQIALFYTLSAKLVYRDFFNTLLSKAARSARACAHYEAERPRREVRGSYYCTKHNRICNPPPQLKVFISRYIFDAVARVEEYSLIRKSTQFEVFCKDTRKAGIPYNTDLIITSPPYYNVLNYHEDNLYAFEILGLSKNEETEIGARKTLETSIEEYRINIKDAFLNLSRNIKPGTAVIVVVCDRAGIFDANEFGFEEKGRLRREVDRRSGKRKNVYFEDVLIWRS